MPSTNKPAEDRPVVVGIEIVTKRRYAIHASTEESALELIRLFEHDQNPTIVNGGSCGGANAMAIDRARSSVERISLEAEDLSNTTTDPVQGLLYQFWKLTVGQQREVIDHITHGFTDDGSP